MRKPRDFDAELKALHDKAKRLKERKVKQLGELVIAAGADALGIDALTGALLVIAENKEPERKEAWRKRGAAFFRKPSRKSTTRSQTTLRKDQSHTARDKANPSNAKPH